LKVLIVTGRLAKKDIEKYVRESGVKAVVNSLPVDVAALIPQKLIVEKLRKLDLSDIDLILTPGLMPGDVSRISKELGVGVFKGPKYASDLRTVLRSISEVSLSTTKPACDLLKERIRKSTMTELEAVYKKFSTPPTYKGSIPIGRGKRKIWVGGLQPPRVLAEIVDASIMSSNAIKAKAAYYSESGADIVDIGMVAGGGDVENVKRAIRIVKDTVPKPISIDTGDVEEIRTAVEEDIDLILSLNGDTLKDARFARNIPIVVTPSQAQGKCPSNVEEKIEALENNIKTAEQLGFKWIIADPVLAPVLTQSLAESLTVYWNFRKRNPEIPILFGAGNVTELMDADSIGANLILAGLALEMEANIILTTEASSKTRGCVKELSKSVKMTVLAKARKAPPKDLGLDLLQLKDKVSRDEAKPSLEKVKLLPVEKKHKLVYDPKGCFKIMVDRSSNEIFLIHYSYKDGRPDIAFKGKDPLTMCRTALAEGLISRVDHAAYLGSELLKAQIALQTGKSYIQDEPLFE